MSHHNHSTGSLNPNLVFETGSELQESYRRSIGGTFSDYMALLKSQVSATAKNFGRTVSLKTALTVLAAVLVLVFFGRSLKDILVITGLGIAASYSTIYKRTIRIPSAIELVTLGTVVTGVAYGPVVGAAFGIVTTFASEIISSGIDVMTVFYATARGISGVAAYFLAGILGIVGLGMVAIAIFNVLCQPVYQLSGDVEARIKGIYYFVINTLFNLIVFAFFGGILLGIAEL